MSTKIEASIEVEIETTEADEPAAVPAASPRKPLVLGREVVRVLNVRSGVVAGCECIHVSVGLWRH